MNLYRYVDSFYGLDMSDMKMPLITVFYSPVDMPNRYIARLFDLEKPTDCVVKGNTLEEIRKAIPPRFKQVPRMKNDHDSVVEVWI